MPIVSDTLFRVAPPALRVTLPMLVVPSRKVTVPVAPAAVAESVAVSEIVAGSTTSFDEAVIAKVVVAGLTVKEVVTGGAGS